MYRLKNSPHGHRNVGRTKTSNSMYQEKPGTTKSTIKVRPSTTPGVLPETAKHLGKEMTEMSVSNTSLTSLLSCSCDVQATVTDTLSGDDIIDDSSHEENALIPDSKPNEDGDDIDDKGDGLEETRAETIAQDKEVTEVKFVIPDRQQDAEDFDFRKFLIEVEQLAASLQAVVRRQETEDFQGDSLTEMVSAVVGTMNNFKAFSNRVYELLETVRDRMKTAADFMNQTIFRPTKCDHLTFEG